MRKHNAAGAHDMTEGPVFRELIAFTIPLIMGNILQLTYNAIDGMIVGRFVGKNALAAVGCAGIMTAAVPAARRAAALMSASWQLFSSPGV